jgi:KaiC/GvpD/RAD55 family RecA-like ATPase
MALYKSTALTNKTIKLIGDFQSGKVKPINTGIPHLDKACFGGLTPSLIVGICARSFAGKTFDLERIQSHIKENEPDVIMINGNYELNFFKILLRDIAQKTNKTQAEILYNNPTAEELIELGRICDVHRNDNIYYQNEPVTPEQFFEDVKSIIDAFPTKKIVVTVDNLENILDTKGSQKSSIDSFLTQINRLKDMHWFISFLILNQLNDNILQRLDNPKQHKPKESDIYSSGQFYKLCDVLYVKVLPWRMHLTDKFMVFAKEAYDWLEDFKIYGNGNTASFDPIGIAYYFYLKRRGSDVKDMQDVFAERIFKAEEAKGNTPKISNLSTAIPIFSMPVFEKEAPITPIFDLSKAFDPPGKDNSEPF